MMDESQHTNPEPQPEQPPIPRIVLPRMRPKRSNKKYWIISGIALAEYFVLALGSVYCIGCVRLKQKSILNRLQLFRFFDSYMKFMVEKDF